jgi:hypothetical protein
VPGSADALLRNVGHAGKKKGPKKKPLVVVAGDSMQMLSSQQLAAPELQGIPRGKRILVVGDGDFSFSVALAISLGGSTLTCSTFEPDLPELQDKYPSVLTNIDVLKNCGATICYGVDGRKLEEYHDWSTAHFDIIIFNFPHEGGQEIAANQALILDFLRSSRNVLSAKGIVRLALRDTPFYAKWKVPDLADQAGFFLKAAPVFDVASFCGYAPVRTKSANLTRGAPTAEGSARVYILVKTKVPAAPVPSQE